MSAGFINVIIDSSNFLMEFIIAESIAQFISINKEGLIMFKNNVYKTYTNVERYIRHSTVSLGAHLSYRLSLLTSL